MSSEKNVKEYLPLGAIEEVGLSKGSESYLAKSIPSGEKYPRLTISDVEDRFVTLKVAKKLLKVAHLVYVRRLWKEGKLEGIRVKVSGGSRVLLTRESIESYTRRVVRSRELRNYILRIRMEEEDQVRSLLKEAGIRYNLELAYESDGKETKEGDTLWASVVDKLEE